MMRRWPTCSSAGVMHSALGELVAAATRTPIAVLLRRMTPEQVRECFEDEHEYLLYGALNETE
jgi:hypothetical protein